MTDNKAVSCTELAVKLFSGNFNCAESVFKATCETFGVEGHGLVPRVASGFGAGFGRLGHVCGALTGGIMGLGAVFGRDAADGDRDRIYSRVVRLEKEFRERCGSIGCRDIIGYDMTTPEGMKAAKESGVFETKCVACVRAAAEIVGNICSEQ